MGIMEPKADGESGHHPKILEGNKDLKYMSREFVTINDIQASLCSNGPGKAPNLVDQ